MSEYPAVVIIAPSAERGEGAAPPPTRSCPSLKCRNFWRAGSVYDAPLDAPPLPEEQVTPSDFAHARVHPKFLHTNATSHKWAFGAIAELLDNAVDEICNGATFVRVDKVNNQKDNSPIFLVQDDGAGMDPEGIRGCMSLGFSTKKSKTTIGQYGNGFKTSTMRLGADAIVFSRAVRGGRATQSIGLLSYTYLRRTMKDDIVVPMIDFQILGDQVVPLPYSSQDDWNDSLKVILDWSPFFSREDLLLQFKDVGSHGTKVLIYNLWMDDDGLLELDFDDDDEDILLRNQVNNGGASGTPKEIVQSHISNTHKYSLRAYASILYLRKFTNFQIILRGKPVEHYNIKDELKFTKTITYKPQVGIAAEVVSVKTTIGFAKEAPVLGIFGINVYHKNRLIMPFWKVVQEGSSRGRCVIGVLEANFMEPAHDKQDFERTALFIRLESKLRQFVYEYWRDHCHLIGYQSSSMRNKPKVSDKCSHDVTPKGQKKIHATHVTGISAGVGEPVIELADDFRHMQSTEHIVGLPAVNGSTGLPSAPIPNFEIETSEPREVENFEDFEGIQSMDFAEPNLIEKVVEENIQLFGRRDELQRRETQLKHMIEELQSELEKTKRKCARAASELEIRKQHLSAG